MRCQPHGKWHQEGVGWTRSGAVAPAKLPCWSPGISSFSREPGTAGWGSLGRFVYAPTQKRGYWDAFYYYYFYPSLHFPWHFHSSRKPQVWICGFYWKYLHSSNYGEVYFCAQKAHKPPLNPTETLFWDCVTLWLPWLPAAGWAVLWAWKINVRFCPCVLMYNILGDHYLLVWYFWKLH